jgi:hypothetical protein
VSSWEDLLAFVHQEYRVIDRREDEVRVEVEFDDERSQVIIINRETLDNREEWVQLVSVCGLADNVDLRALLETVGHNSVVCGVAIIGDHVVLRHALPLENLDINEFTDPLSLLAGTADTLEETFFGGDGF